MSLLCKPNSDIAANLSGNKEGRQSYAMPTVTAPTRRGRLSPAESLALKAELLRIARQHFVSEGFRATTMSDIAAAAGLTKRTLYSWHGDKAALFHACVIEGAQRLPVPDIDDTKDVESALYSYAIALVQEFAEENNFGMGLLFVREGHDFPELGSMIDRSFKLYVVEPLAAYLRKQGLESTGSAQRAELFTSMALAPVHNRLLLGRSIPDTQTIQLHASLVVEVFLRGATDP